MNIKTLISVFSTFVFLNSCAPPKSLDAAFLDQVENMSADQASAKLARLSMQYGLEVKSKIDEEKIPILAGYIDHQFLNDFRNIISSNDTIAIYSTGGIADVSYNLAELIRANKINIVIIGSCYSACAESILPAANSIWFYDNPLIGFHGNLHSMKYFAEKGMKDPCSPDSNQADFIYGLSDLVDRKEELYNSTGHNIQFWKDQIERLGTPEFVVSPVKAIGIECTFIQQFPYEFWYPTSGQLISKLGLKFKGSVCADDPDCFTRKIPLQQGLGKKYIVENDAYESALP